LKRRYEKMTEGKFSIKKATPIIIVTWVLSLLTTLAIAYFTPLIPIGTNQIGDSAVTTSKIADGTIINVKLADGSVTSAKILNGTITAVDIANGSIITINIADGSITTTKIADEAVTTEKLASAAIPFNTTYGVYDYSTSEMYRFEEIPDMSVNITLSRKCHLLIFSTLTVRVDPNYLSVWVKANVTSSTTTETALPLSIGVFPGSTNKPFACNFHVPELNAGTYNVKIMWQLSGLGWATVRERTLTVIALPA